LAYNDGGDPTLVELISRYWVPKIYSKNVIEHTKSNLVVAASVNVEYRREMSFGDQVYIPVTTEPSTGEVTAGTELTAQDVTTTGTSLTINKWRGVRTEASEIMKVEDHVGYLDKSAKSCAYAIAKNVDTDLGALFSSLYTSLGTYGTDGQTLSDDIILAVMEVLDEADVLTHSDTIKGIFRLLWLIYSPSFYIAVSSLRNKGTGHRNIS